MIFATHNKGKQSLSLPLRSSNAAISSFGIAVRHGCRAAAFAKSSRCEKFPIQTGWTCLERYESHLPIQTDLGNEEEMCEICAHLYSVTSDAATTDFFDDGMVHPQNRRKYSSEPAPPSTIAELEEEFTKRSILQAQFKGTECESHYNLQKEVAKDLLDKALADWMAKITQKKEKKRRETQRLYSLGRFGEAEEIRKLLFHISASLLDPGDFKEIVFAINSYSGECVCV